MLAKQDTVDLMTPTGAMRTKVFSPDKTDRQYPGLLLYSEIFQITPPIGRLAAQFASQGYVVMVPEIYHEHEKPGTVISYDDAGKKKGNDYKVSTKLSTFDADAGVVIRALKMDPLCNGQVGTVGFCIGGHLSFRAALNPDIKAAACFYPTDLHSGTLGAGKNADTLARAKEIRGEVMMIFGRQDPHVPLDGRKLIHDKLEESGILYTWHEFNCAHAFMRDEDERHSPQAARACMGLALDLFARNL